MTKKDLVDRAQSAYFRSGADLQPDRGMSGLTEEKGREYVVLANNSATLAVYRVLNSGKAEALRKVAKGY